jgi:hypothetical protein
MAGGYSMAAARKTFYWRAFVSFYMVLSILIVAASGAVLYIAPPGRIANWSYWALGALDKSRWQAVHTIFAFLFAVTAIVHVYFNWRVILGYLRRHVGEGMRRKWELALSGVAVASIFGLTVARVAPFSTVMTAGENLKNSWATPANEPPVPHAEAWTVAKFAETTKIPVEQATSNLQKAGIEVASQDTTLLDLARRHNMTPQEVYVAARGTATPAHVPLAEGGGFGRKTVQQLCEQVGVPAESGVQRLRAAGIDATTSSNIRELATRYGKAPFEVARIIEGQ